MRLDRLEHREPRSSIRTGHTPDEALVDQRSECVDDRRIAEARNVAGDPLEVRKTGTREQREEL